MFSDRSVGVMFMSSIDLKSTCINAIYIYIYIEDVQVFYFFLWFSLFFQMLSNVIAES